MFQLAWRNIWRNKRRTALTSLGIAFAVSILQFFNGIQLKSYDAAVNASVSMYFGHIQIQREGYLDQPEVRASFSNYEPLLSLARSLPRVIEATPRGYGFALLSSGDRTYGAQIVGVDIAHEPTVSSIPGNIRAGTFLKNPETEELILGRSLAENLHVNVGDTLTLLGQGADGSLAASIVPVVGIFETGSRDLDRNIAEMPLASFQQLFGVGDSVHTVVVRLDGSSSLPQSIATLASEVQKVGPSDSKLRVLSWEDLLPGLKQSIELDMSFGWLFFFSLILVVTFSVANTLLMSVLERTREFGVMLSLGATPLRVVRLIFIEALFIALVGCVVGSLIGSGVITYFGTYGFSVPGTEEILKIWNLPSKVFPEVTIKVLLLAPLIICGTTLLAALYPALKLLGLEPVTAMRAT